MNKRAAYLETGAARRKVNRTMANLETDESAYIPDIVKQELEDLEKELAAATGDEAAPGHTDDVTTPEKPDMPAQTQTVQ